MKKTLIAVAMSLLTVFPFAACHTEEVDELEEEEAGTVQEAVKNTDFHIFVIAMENHDAGQIFGNSTDASYINGTLIPAGTKGTNFSDTLPWLWSEPHYILMEAGKHDFGDHKFESDDNPSATNSTNTTAHLVTQMKNNNLTWMSYQEGMKSGTCPISSNGNYAPKHNPFVFFQDVAGNPPSASNQYCKDHHRVYTHSSFKTDLTSTTMANYVFITPDLSNDMHDGCSTYPNNPIKCGDTWLGKAVPPILDYLKTNKGVLFIVWDEGENSAIIPFLALGPTVKVNFNSTVRFSHGSLVKSIDRIFGLPVLSAATKSNDLRNIFTSGNVPWDTASLGDECPIDASKIQPGVCGCGKKERSNTAGFVDAKGYGCNDWIDYDCTRAAEDHGYTAAQESNLLANCSLSCGVCK